MKKLLLLLLVLATSGCLLRGPASTESEKFVLDNGMTLVVKENHANRIVATKLLVKSGSQSESPEEIGVRNFVQEMLLKGTANRTSEDIAFETDSMGISLFTSVADDYLEITVVSTKDFFAQSMDILADIVTNPIFPEKEIEAERERILEGIKAQEDDQFTSARLLFQKELYGGHPYGYNSLGSGDTIRAINRGALLRFHRDNYVPNNIVVAVVGDVDAREVKAKVEERFGEQKPRELSMTPEIQVSGRGGNASVERKREQSFIIIGFLAAPVASEDYPVLKVLSSVLGGGSSSRLYVDLRGERGLAYQVGSFYPTRLDDSFVAAYIGTAPDNEKDVIELLHREFEALKNRQVSDDELAVAKRSIIGDFELDHESNERQAFYLAWYEAIGLGYGYDIVYPYDVSSVTAPEVQRVAQKYLLSPVIARVGP